MAASTILSGFQRPTGQDISQQPSQTMSIGMNSSYDHSNETNPSIHWIRYVTTHLSQFLRNGTIPEHIHLASLAMPKPAQFSGLISSFSDNSKQSCTEDTWAHALNDAHLHGLCKKLQNMCRRHRSTSPMAISTANTFYPTPWNHLCYSSCDKFQQLQWNDSTMISNVNTGIIGLPTGNIQNTGVTDGMAAQNGIHNLTQCSEVWSRYEWSFK